MGFYGDSTDWSCKSCHDGCEVCYGAGLEKCTKCKIDTVSDPDVPYYKVANIDECTTACSTGYYEEDAG